MVKLTKIYTRTGDDGTTGLGTGVRTPKDSLRVEAYGEVDEANAALGLAILECSRDPGSAAALAPHLTRIQQDLFDLGADLCIPIDPRETPGSKLRMIPEQTARLESLIDQHPLPPLNSFILPGGSPAAVALHLARTVTRRAERRVVTLHRSEPGSTNPETIKYLNRLSDLLFVLARVANDNGAKDVLWVPGANRPK